MYMFIVYKCELKMFNGFDYVDSVIVVRGKVINNFKIVKRLYKFCKGRVI